MCSGINYNKEMKELAVSHNCPLFTIDIDDRHLDNERTKLTIQGPLSKEHEALLRRTLLTIHGVPPRKIKMMLKEGLQAIHYFIFKPRC